VPSCRACLVSDAYSQTSAMTGAITHIGIILESKIVVNSRIESHNVGFRFSAKPMLHTRKLPVIILAEVTDSL
jgi:hypothetical protein